MYALVQPFHSGYSIVCRAASLIKKSLAKILNFTGSFMPDLYL